MNLVGAFIAVGYVALIGVWGWWGVIAAAAHVAVLALTVRRK